MALKIPTVGIAVDVRQLLDAKLMECSHEPMKVQVVVSVRCWQSSLRFSQPMPLPLYQCLTLCQALTDVSILPTACFCHWFGVNGR